jgi:hypothetical protein
MAVRAAVAAVEEAGGKAVLPLEFQAKYVPTKRSLEEKGEVSAEIRVGSVAVAGKQINIVPSPLT